MESVPPRADIPVLASLPLVIEASKFRLRPVALSDVEDLWPFVSDPELPKHMSWRAHRDRDETTAFVQSQIDGLAAGKLINWVIEIAGKAAADVTLSGITLAVLDRLARRSRGARLLARPAATGASGS